MLCVASHANFQLLTSIFSDTHSRHYHSQLLHASSSTKDSGLDSLREVFLMFTLTKSYQYAAGPYINVDFRYLYRHFEENLGRCVSRGGRVGKTF